MSHRPVFESATDKNCFWGIDEDGNIFFDGELAAIVPGYISDDIDFHNRYGTHPDCYVCKQAHEAIMKLVATFDDDPRTPAQRDADQHDAETRETQESARPC